MSADNWDYCPRCRMLGEAKLRELEAEVAALYGAVPVDVFDVARSNLEAIRRQLGAPARTFREDYEIFGAEHGEVTVSYSGKCTVCGLELSFQDTRPIPNVEPS